MKQFWKGIAAGGLLVSGYPAQAQDSATISAGDPDGMVVALQSRDYEATLVKDSAGDPMIRLEMSGIPVRLVFYECEKPTGSNCKSFAFSAGFDREKPWSAEAAITISQRHRFAAIELDDEGDPFITWDVITGLGIPLEVFLDSVDAFHATVDNVADEVFAEERAAN